MCAKISSSKPSSPRTLPGRCRLRCFNYALLSSALTLTCQAHGLPEDADQPIKIRADEARLDQVGRSGVYSGDVQVDQGTLRINADTMTVMYRDKKVTQITFTGSPAKYRQQLNANEDMVFANAGTIIYITATERLKLQGDASLTQQGNELHGQQIDYDIVAGKVDAESNGDGPIRMVLEPQREPERKTAPADSTPAAKATDDQQP